MPQVYGGKFTSPGDGTNWSCRHKMKTTLMGCYSVVQPTMYLVPDLIKFSLRLDTLWLGSFRLPITNPRRNI